jgi:hypothetical protein
MRSFGGRKYTPKHNTSKNNIELENHSGTFKKVKGVKGSLLRQHKIPKFYDKDNAKMSKFSFDESNRERKKTRRNNMSYPNMNDIFNASQPKTKSKNTMFGTNTNMFDMAGMSKKGFKNSSMFDGFDIPNTGSKGRGFAPKLNFFGMEDERIPKKSSKFYNKIKEKKLNGSDDFGDWGKLDDYSSEFKLGF